MNNSSRPSLAALLGCLLFLISQSTTCTQAQTGTAAVTEIKPPDWLHSKPIPAIPGLPFTAKVELEMDSNLPGNQSAHSTYMIVARDFQGRTRNEARNWVDPAQAGSDPPPTLIEIYDPSANVRTDLFPQTGLAIQWEAGGESPKRSGNSKTPQPKITVEDLGVDTIEGLPVHGFRVHEIPFNLTKDAPYFGPVDTDYWYSGDLKINMVTKCFNPQFGLRTVRVTDIQRKEPDPALFALPETYKLQHKKVTDPETEALAPLEEVKFPKCKYCPAPEYSDQARDAKYQGVVYLRIIVTSDGRAEAVRVVKPLGYGLDEQAVLAVKQWRFQPAQGADGNPISEFAPIEVTFRLVGNPF
jgi:TonB family protein